MSKKQSIVSGSIIVVVGGLLFFSFRLSSVSPVPQPRTILRQAQEVRGSVSLHIDFGDGNPWNFSDIPYVTGATAFSILKDVKVPMMYDPSTGAGVFIQQIADKKNGDGGRYWQYWVNEKFAMIAADKYALQPNDRVEWKFAVEQKE